MRLLLADDHPMIRAAIEVLLRDSGFEIVGMAGTGQETLEESRLQPDIILLDVRMPTAMGSTCFGGSAPSSPAPVSYC
jgi:DNA-binding NarL/FixJ family response regulator